MNETRFIVAPLALLLVLLTAQVTRAQDTVFMSGFFVEEPLVASSDPAATAVLPVDAEYIFISPQGDFLAGPVRLTWWADEEAYAFMALPEELLRDVLYRPILLSENTILWQSAYPFDPDGLVVYEVFVTLHYDDALIPLYIDADKLNITLQMAGVMLVPTPQTPGLANAPGIWTLVGRSDAIQTALTEVVEVENAVTYDHIIVPSAP